MSRAMKDEEEDQFEKKFGYRPTQIAMPLQSSQLAAGSQPTAVPISGNVAVPPSVQAGVAANLENISGVQQRVEPVANVAEQATRTPEAQVPVQPTSTVVQQAPAEQLDVVRQIDLAIQSSADPKIFAQQLVQVIGVETMKQVVAGGSSAELADLLVAQYGAQSATLATRDGRRFLIAALDEARKIVANG